MKKGCLTLKIVTYFVVAVNNKQIDSLCDSFIVNTTRGDARALCKLASVKTRQIHHKDDEVTEISKRMAYSAKLVGNETLA